MLSKKMEYGYLILKKMEKLNSNEMITGKKFLEELAVPKGVGLRILTELSSAGLIGSEKGMWGGFYKKEIRITMLDLFIALEKDLNYAQLKKEDKSFREIKLEIGTKLLEALKNIEIYN